MKTIEDMLRETQDEFEKTFKGVNVDYSSLMKKADEAGPGVGIVTIPRFIERVVMMAYQAGAESKNEEV